MRDPHAVGTHDREPGFGEQIAQLRGKTKPVLVAALAEARRVERGAARARGGALAQIAQRDLGRREDNEMVRRFGQRFEIWEAGSAPDLATVRIDREHSAGKAEAAEVVPHAPRPMVGAVRRPDQDHVTRLKQSVDCFVFAHLFVPFQGCTAYAVQPSAARRNGPRPGR